MSPSDKAERALNAYIGVRIEEDDNYENRETRAHLVHLLRDLCHLIDEQGFVPRYLCSEAIAQWQEETRS